MSSVRSDSHARQVNFVPFAIVAIAAIIAAGVGVAWSAGWYGNPAKNAFDDSQLTKILAQTVDDGSDDLPPCCAAIDAEQLAELAAFESAAQARIAAEANADEKCPLCLEEGTSATLPVSAPARPADTVLPIENAEAKAEAEMKPYEEKLEHTEVTLKMVPIPGGTFLMGSPDKEADRNKDEGPQREVKIAPFWMSNCEITWDAYEIWMFDLDEKTREAMQFPKTVRDELAKEYQEAQPTQPYTDMTFGMGKRGYPAICMTQLAARTYCQWLTEKTGRYYRLPTEAEWEYACRAGSTTAYHFGNDPAQLDEYAWYYDNSSEKYQRVGQKKANPWGLYDMHGNVAEWTLDQYMDDFYGSDAAKELNPLAIPKTEYPRVVRGGSWDDDPALLRSAARIGSTPDWKRQDPQIPKSIWYFTDALHVGFRIVRPLEEPTAEEKAAKWDKHEPVENRKKGRE